MQKGILLSDGRLRAEINPENGQLVSLIAGGIEYFHDGGKTSYEGPGWKDSEIIPFPIFGPPVDYQVRIKDKVFPLDQHGISRHTKTNPFIVSPRELAQSLMLVQEYDGRPVPNSKYTQGSDRPKELRWLPYGLGKTLTLGEGALVCDLTLTNRASVPMPYMIGWHPGFTVQGEVQDGEFMDDRGVRVATLDEVIEYSSIPPKEALVMEGLSSMTYRNRKTGRGVRVASDDFSDNVMLWSPSSNAGMFSIEFTTLLPLHDGTRHFDDQEKFEVLTPGESRTYSILVRPL